MRTKRNLSVESLERRELFTGMPGVEGFDIDHEPMQSQGSGTLIGPTVYVVQHHANDDGGAGLLGLIHGNGDDDSYNAGLISSPLDLSQMPSLPDARDQLMAMVETGEAPLDHEWINSLTSTEDGESNGI